ncbi:MAG: hypothetical protein K1X53_17110 [Candidatus Sumerlaeaceae bacterium]|nr:hypothetical protein [Candidatus Sumerlaeaceae bacterium]
MSDKTPKEGTTPDADGFTDNVNARLDKVLRVAIPAKFVDVLAANYPEHKGRVVLVPGKDCVRVFPVPVWEVEKERLLKLDSLNPKVAKLRRVVFGNKKECTLDPQNRVRLSEQQVKNGKLRDDKPAEGDETSTEVAVVGQIDRLEIWNYQRWCSYNEGIDVDEAFGEVFSEAGLV